MRRRPVTRPVRLLLLPLLLAVVFLRLAFSLPSARNEDEDHPAVVALTRDWQEASSRARQLDPAMSLMRKYRVPVHEEDPPDFNNAIFDDDARMLREQADELAPHALALSLRLMARPGHRHRVSALIGGEHWTPSKLCTELQSTIVFNSAREHAEQARDYGASPLRVDLPPFECAALPCESCNGSRCDANSFSLSMENAGGPLTRVKTMHVTGLERLLAPEVLAKANIPFSDPEGRFFVYGDTRLISRVPVPYMSWHDFGVMLPARRNKSRLAAAFISNCRFAKRNAMLTNLRRYTGNRVHSYGACLRTDSEDGPRGQHSKLGLLQDHKFSLAFENSESVDYVSEKFFESLVGECAGQLVARV